jgi:alkanesulfonate monooxygenase SsuD/methylene tetrahydromethanopterin reductase-like flavin-dependent oxidoreductase (luciferase family)
MQECGMEFAIQTVGRSYQGFLDAARWAEAKGLAAFAIPDHYMYRADADGSPTPAYDAFAIMAGLSRETVRIELVVLVSPITFRHPAVLAKSAATIQEMSEGRFKLGLGTGWLEVEHQRFGIDFPDLPVRFRMMEEALGYLRAAFSDSPRDFNGDHFALTGFDIQPRPELSVVVGGTGTRRTPRLAGAYANEFNAYPAPQSVFGAKVERAREAARAAGRDPDALLISSSGVVIAADTAADYHDKLRALADEAGRDADEIEQDAEKRNAPRGTWEQVRSIMGEMAAAGMTRFYFQGDFDQTDLELKLSKLT